MTNATLTKVASTTVNWTRNARALKAMAEFKALKAIEAAGVKAKERRTKEVEPILREELGDATEVIVRGVTALKVVASSNSKIDAPTLKEGWPEAYEATFVSTPYTFLKVL